MRCLFKFYHYLQLVRRAQNGKYRIGSSPLIYFIQKNYFYCFNVDEIGISKKSQIFPKSSQMFNNLKNRPKTSQIRPIIEENFPRRRTNGNQLSRKLTTNKFSWRECTFCFIFEWTMSISAYESYVAKSAHFHATFVCCSCSSFWNYKMENLTF